MKLAQSEKTGVFERNPPKLWNQIRRIGVDFFDDMLSEGG